MRGTDDRLAINTNTQSLIAEETNDQDSLSLLNEPSTSNINVRVNEIDMAAESLNSNCGQIIEQ